MRISFHDLGKKFGSAHWVVRKKSATLEPGDTVAITGNNGSGKSTLLQLLSGLLIPSAGTLEYELKNNPLTKEEALGRMNVAAPYIELIEDFTLMEFLAFHFKFRKQYGISGLEELVDILYLGGNEHKKVKNFSSGMKQRLKLGLAFYSEGDVIFLDEPTTNLDEKGIQWYLNQTEKIIGQKTFVISSNQKVEYDFCDKIINMNEELNK